MGTILRSKPIWGVASRSKVEMSRKKFEYMVNRTQHYKISRLIKRAFYHSRPYTRSTRLRISQPHERRNELFSAQAAQAKKQVERGQARQLESYNRTANRHNLSSAANKIYARETGSRPAASIIPQTAFTAKLPRSEPIFIS
ncbi:Uncharacterised protein [uncultured archaeon]|nr:Uncharacterised protein [uncultured archaeon]